MLIGTCESGIFFLLALEFVCWTVRGGRCQGWLADDGRMAYIDSELAKRRSESQTQVHAQGQVQNTASSTVSGREVRQLVDRERKREKEVQRQPAALGKLQEIDLGDEARNRNVAQTERARRRLDGEEVEEEEEGEKKVQKVRLGPDGKPWRGRKRRGSEDVKRDKMVEDVLRENRRTSRLHVNLFNADVFSQWKYTMSSPLSPQRSMTTKRQMIE